MIIFEEKMQCLKIQEKYREVLGLKGGNQVIQTLSLRTTLKFQTYSKVTKCGDPGPWIFHKGLTFTKRKSSLKILKDLYGIWYVASQLGEFSESQGAWKVFSLPEPFSSSYRINKSL